MLDNVIPISSPMDLVNFIASPPILLVSNYVDRASFSLYGSLMLYHLWKLRNEIVFAGKQIDHMQLHQCIFKAFKDHSAPWASPRTDDMLHDNIPPKTPDLGWTKPNTDTTRSNLASCILGVATSPDNEVIFSWFSKASTTSPLQAEGQAVLLALSITLDRGWH
ncbi:hypothetical protein CDL15_Pgr004108 [Punica granatum]|uniref:RNase H type-1 domain-containing protein n=1 Tax=Punica granatum TaxID=22663 RepID=A0A218XFW2_PUNGR|nr:hypothetical protein CDL15_Pgr004108 [Punica granatum]